MYSPGTSPFPSPLKPALYSPELLTQSRAFVAELPATFHLLRVEGDDPAPQGSAVRRRSPCHGPGRAHRPVARRVAAEFSPQPANPQTKTAPSIVSVLRNTKYALRDDGRAEHPPVHWFKN